ncbi:MAG: hydroxymethylbilane synthase [Deltaproteobacteria bacterium]|nr:hydroxymethylbilane synthase [Deltaproteobacteria bacterium]
MSEGGGTLRVGTRGSALAVRQAQWVAAAIRARGPAASVEIVRIRTSGDRVHDRPLVEIGGKGLFVKEIEEALLEGRVDVAVHSMKDLPAALASGLAIVAVPPREDPGDALITASRGGLSGLAPGARVGTGSLRRRVFLRHARPDLEIVPMRGNVDTRLAKWRAGEVDALILARAGLRRLGIEIAEAQPLSPDEMLPAIGQGALAIEARPGSPWWSVLAALDDPPSAAAVGAERAFLRGMGGDCTTPIAAHAVIENGELRLAAAIGDPEGRALVRGESRGSPSEGEAMGGALAAEMLSRGGREILQGLGR